MAKQLASLQKQSSAEPLFPDILWNQPVNKRAAGTLLVVGGHSQQFALTQSRYQAVLAAGIGSAKVVLPDRIRKLTGPLPDCEFIASTPSGSIAREASQEVLAMAAQCDGVLLGGELSNNTETLGFAESLLQEAEIPVFITGEVVEQLLPSPDAIARASMVIASPLQLSRWAKTFNIPVYVKAANVHKELQLLQALAEVYDGALVDVTEDHVLASSNGQQSVTPLQSCDFSRLIGETVVFYLQHRDKFQAITSGVWRAVHPSQVVD